MAEEKKTPEKTPVKAISHREVVVVLPAIKAPGWLQGFLDFVREQGVVGLGVGLILGVAAKSVIDALVQSILNPIVGLLYGGGDFSTKFVCIKSGVEAGKTVCKSKLGYGSFINALVSFFLIAAVVYFLVKKLKLDKLDKIEKKKV